MPKKAIEEIKTLFETDDVPTAQDFVDLIDTLNDADYIDNAINMHTGLFRHGDITHSNRISLDQVSGINSGDQDLSAYATHTELDARINALVDDAPTALNTLKELATQLQSDESAVNALTLSVNGKESVGVAAALDTAHLAAINHNNISHANRLELDLVSGVNTGDQDLSTLVVKVPGKQLSTEDYTTAEKNRLASIAGNGMVDWSTPVNLDNAAATTLQISKHYVITATTASVIHTLPNYMLSTGKLISVEISASSTKLVTISGGGAYIDGLTSRVMAQKETAILYCNGSTWTKVAGKSVPFSTAMRVSANQLFAAGTTTKLKMDAIVATNFSGMCDAAVNYGFIAPRPGLYNLETNISFGSANGVAGDGRAMLYDGVSQLTSVTCYRNKNAICSCNANIITELAAADKICSYGYFTGGSFTTSSLYISATDNIMYLTEIPTW